MYGLMLLFIFILQVVAAIFAYSLQPQIRDMLLKNMNESLYEYESDEYIGETVDLLQGSVSLFYSSLFHAWNKNGGCY